MRSENVIIISPRSIKITTTHFRPLCVALDSYPLVNLLLSIGGSYSVVLIAYVDSCNVLWFYPPPPQYPFSLRIIEHSILVFVGYR